MMTDSKIRFERLDSLLEQQQEPIERRRDRIAEPEAKGGDAERNKNTVLVSRRHALTTGGLFASVGTASADVS